jgi:hypothetical protein
VVADGFSMRASKRFVYSACSVPVESIEALQLHTHAEQNAFDGVLPAGVGILAPCKQMASNERLDHRPGFVFGQLGGARAVYVSNNLGGVGIRVLSGKSNSHVNLSCGGCCSWMMPGR